jgi:hypothetical protein
MLPDVPDVPELPDVPEVPDEPDEPEVPDDPFDPDVPDVPEVPDEPDEPDVPEVPELPEVPEVPDEPDEPEVPDEPDEPEVPDDAAFSLYPSCPVAFITSTVCSVEWLGSVPTKFILSESNVISSLASISNIGIPEISDTVNNVPVKSSVTENNCPCDPCMSRMVEPDPDMVKVFPSKVKFDSTVPVPSPS